LTILSPDKSFWYPRCGFIHNRPSGKVRSVTWIHVHV